MQIPSKHFKKIREFFNQDIGEVVASMDFIKQIPNYLTFVFIAIIVFQLVTVTWKVIFPVNTSSYALEVTTLTKDGLSYNNLTEDPFANSPNQTLNQTFDIDAPPTSLSLRLYGIRYSDSGKANAAILGFDPNNQRIYKTNDVIADDIVLEYIEPERVIISRGGITESVTFEKDSVLSKTFTNSLANKDNTTPKINWIDTEIDLVSDMITFQPYFSDGSIKGYQLYPGDDSSLFNQSGLQPGDVLVAVNGLSVRDPSVLKELSGISDVRLDLVRDEDDLSITLSLD
ncbi:MAG: type II secretion system protein N [Pseudomonadota bacterium]|nr:type II secretion system protein N [Pseudomonadota bacterium]|tara:strand:- start:1334 stop:2191 length:858 start_codon:yes stop_codon:yes gene_type:complete